MTGYKSSGISPMIVHIFQQFDFASFINFRLPKFACPLVTTRRKTLITASTEYNDQTQSKINRFNRYSRNIALRDYGEDHEM